MCVSVLRDNTSVERVKALLEHKAFERRGNTHRSRSRARAINTNTKQSKDGMNKLLITYEARKTNSHLVVSLILFSWLILHTYLPLTLRLKVLALVRSNAPQTANK